MMLPVITPGPEWSFNASHDEHPRFGIFTKGNVILARVWMENDAKAIAAVPSLLEALNDAATTLRIMAEIAEDLRLEGAPMIREREAECLAALRLAGASDA